MSHCRFNGWFGWCWWMEKEEEEEEEEEDLEKNDDGGGGATTTAATGSNGQGCHITNIGAHTHVLA
jgi:hypothetical protein